MYPKYQVRLYDNTNFGLYWGNIPVWDETIGGISLAELVEAVTKYCQAFKPNITQFRVNEKGSFQGQYFNIPRKEQDQWMNSNFHTLYQPKIGS